MQETPIFSNGDFHGTWHWHAVGCRACKHSDVQQRRNTSGASFSVALEFGSIIFTTTNAHPLRRLDQPAATLTPDNGWAWLCRRLGYQAQSV